jgi:hypothetical protein
VLDGLGREAVTLEPGGGPGVERVPIEASGSSGLIYVIGVAGVCSGVR